MLRKLSPLVIGGLLLTGCAGMGEKPNLFMETSTSRPPPLPIADIPGKVQAPKAKAKREVTPPPIPIPRPAPPVEVKPPHHWYDHLKFWQ